MTAPAFTRPLCGCGGCVPWRRFEYARWQIELSEREHEWHNDIEGWERVLCRYREARRDYLVHVEELGGGAQRAAA